jgi:hypothetical protein
MGCTIIGTFHGALLDFSFENIAHCPAACWRTVEIIERPHCDNSWAFHQAVVADDLACRLSLPPVVLECFYRRWYPCAVVPTALPLQTRPFDRGVSPFEYQAMQANVELGEAQLILKEPTPNVSYGRKSDFDGIRNECLFEVEFVSSGTGVVDHEHSSTVDFSQRLGPLCGRL